jgi:hypothetical protein
MRLPIYLTELIEKLPSDTAERVKRAKDKHNARIREALRHETGLKLTRGASESTSASSTTVPIKIVAGLPAVLADFNIPDEHRLSLLISPWRHQLRQLRDSAKSIERNLLPSLAVHTQGFNLIKGRQLHLKPANELAEDLLKEGDKYDLATNILAVEEDILGRYLYRKTTLFNAADCSIELYWGIIGLIAAQVGVDLEDLTVVILAHELAHAYTHMGLDIDDRKWETQSFHASEKPVIEGLAQHYTMLVSKRMAGQVPNALSAYRTLLECQPAAYQVQKPWETAFSPEQMRSALIGTRRSEKGVSFAMFEGALERSKEQLQ